MYIYNALDTIQELDTLGILDMLNRLKINNILDILEFGNRPETFLVFLYSFEKLKHSK